MRIILKDDENFPLNVYIAFTRYGKISPQVGYWLKKIITF